VQPKNPAGLTKAINQVSVYRIIPSIVKDILISRAFHARLIIRRQLLVLPWLEQEYLASSSLTFHQASGIIMLCMSAVWGRCASSVIGTAGGRATVSVRRKSAARISVLASVSRGPLRCRATGDRNSEERTSKETIGRLERLLGIEPEQEEPEIPRQDVPKERKQEPVEPVVVKSEKEKKRPSDFEEPDWILAEFETDGKPNVPNRALSSASYLLPLLDGLHYGRYFFMQVPQFSLLLLPLVPAINLFESARWLQVRRCPRMPCCCDPLR